jgi:CheY-like chemotaxis protein
LRTEPDAAERGRLLDRVDAAVSSMNELFDALLDLSKLEAGVLEPNPSEFPVQPLLTRLEATFGGVAREKGLRLRVLSTKAWVRSDPILLERIVSNLVSNAVRYTRQGGVVVGCRIRGDLCRIDVCDTGPGIPEAQQRAIFGEFVQLAAGNPDRGGGLGLGLSIVDRLGRLLDHPIEVQSRLGGGSRFSVVVPRAAAQMETVEAAVPSVTLLDPARGKLIVVIDDDPLVLDGMGGILRSWGCRVVAAASAESAALAELRAQRLEPDLIISDLRLADGKTGFAAIELLRRDLGPAIPAFLITGDTAPERVHEARASGYHLLHKPVAPMRLRAMLHQLIKRSEAPVETGPGLERAPTRRRAGKGAALRLR